MLRQHRALDDAIDLKTERNRQQRDNRRRQPRRAKRSVAFAAMAAPL